MKCSEFRRVLLAFADLKAAMRVERCPPLEETLAILEIAPAKTVADLAKKAIRADGARQPSARLVPLWSLHSFLKTCAKPAVLKDLEILLHSLDTWSTEPTLTPALEQVQAAYAKPAKRSGAASKAKPDAQPPRPEVMQSYVRRLEAALGDDVGFRSELARLEADKDLSAKEIAGIAKAFTLAPAKSRPAALKAIKARHQNLMTSRAKSAATAGRIAG